MELYACWNRCMFPLLIITLGVLQVLGHVSKALPDAPGSAELHGTGEMIYIVSQLYIPDTEKCSLDSQTLQCQTPNGPCADNPKCRLVYREPEDGAHLVHNTWYCVIEITNMTENDVGLYYLCQSDTTTKECIENNIEKTNFGTWYIRHVGANIVRCEILYNVDTGERMDNCSSLTITTTRGSSTTGTLATSTVQRVEMTKETTWTTMPIENNSPDYEKNATKGELDGYTCTSPVISGTAIGMLVLGVIIGMTICTFYNKCKKQKPSYEGGIENQTDQDQTNTLMLSNEVNHQQPEQVTEEG